MPDYFQIIGSLLLALVPTLLWGSFYYRKNPEDKKLLFLTFCFGALAVFPILIYKFSWQFFPWLNAFNMAEKYGSGSINIFSSFSIPLSVIITFMLVGLIEEIMKLLSVKMVDKDYFQSIDDSMEFFIAAALGFSFSENILYFYNIWSAHGSTNLLLPFIFRSSFSTFAHIMFSGILGYYYGVAHFAKPILQEEIRANRKHWTILFHKIFSFRKEKMFYQEKILEGLVIAIGLHAIFNIFLEVNLSFMMVPFLLGGYYTLNYLFDKKNAHKDYKKLLFGARNHPSKRAVYFKLNPIKTK